MDERTIPPNPSSSAMVDSPEYRRLYNTLCAFDSAFLAALERSRAMDDTALWTDLEVIKEFRVHVHGDGSASPYTSTKQSLAVWWIAIDFMTKEDAGFPNHVRRDPRDHTRDGPYESPKIKPSGWSATISTIELTAAKLPRQIVKVAETFGGLNDEIYEAVSSRISALDNFLDATDHRSLERKRITLAEQVDRLW
jgi:hypothetical protein